MSLCTLGYISLHAFGNFKRFPHLVTYLYTCTAGSVAITGVTNLLFRRACKDFILKIEFDLEEEHFVVTSPSTSLVDFGSPQEEVVSVSDFKMLPQDKQTETSLYYSQTSGNKYATVGRGQWYN